MIPARTEDMTRKTAERITHKVWKVIPPSQRSVSWTESGQLSQRKNRVALLLTCFMLFCGIARWPSHFGGIQQRCVIKSRRLAPEISYFP